MSFGRGALAQTVLQDVSLELHAGESVLLMGPSGSGKTTLLSILGCMLTPTQGKVWINQQIMNQDSPVCLAIHRRQNLGFVFQHSRLLPFLSVYENLAIVGRNFPISTGLLNQRIQELAKKLDFYVHLKSNPGKLSGGQQQRVAIARAMLCSPKVVLADEPTAALDWKNAQQGVSMLIEQARQNQAALLTVSHDARLIPLFDRLLHIESGILREHAR